MDMKTILAIGAVLLAGAGFVWASAPDDHDHTQHGVKKGGIKLPALSEVAKNGIQHSSFRTVLYATVRTRQAPRTAPLLVHKIYEPTHRTDASFRQAARNGVRAHHWPYGNMPPVPNVTEADVALIIEYVRELQRANGIR